jgi:hypothetical protein
MDSIFVYDDETPVALSVDSQDATLKRQIMVSMSPTSNKISAESNRSSEPQMHGGQVTDVLHAHFHVGRCGRSSILLRNVPLVHPTWVARSVKARRMVPMYEYVEETQEHALGRLSPEQRDLAEMIKAMSQLSFKVFETLHRKVSQAPLSTSSFNF